MKPAARGRPLRLRLFLLAASGLLPLAIVSALVLAYLSGERSRDAREGALLVSRAIATAVDAELRVTIDVLNSLALLDELQPDQLGDFQDLAGRVAASQGWLAAVLADADGKLLLHTALGTNVAADPIDPESMQRAIATLRPVVGAVLPGPRYRLAFAVRVPVLREGRLRYVLSAVLPTDQVLSVLQRQNPPDTAVVAVFDHQLTRVARSRQNTATGPSPSLRALLADGAREGSGLTRTLEGMRSHTGFIRLPDWNWVVATGMSAEQASSGLYGVLATVAAGLLASLALAALAAWYFSRDVIAPIDALKAAAAALGRGEPVPATHLDIAELQDVGAALQQASAERDLAARERREAEAERERLLAQATEALRRAEDAGRSKDEFLAMLGHELRNPLAPMATALHLMKRRGDPGTRMEREVMERQVTHMKRLVDDLLDVSRITGKRLEMRMQPAQLAELVRHAAQAVQPVLGLRPFALELAPGAGELWVSADEVRLGQVLTNLLGNAIKFTGPTDRITLSLQRRGQVAEVQVADTGMGMPPQVLAHVFDLFYQAPQGADRSRGGLGLGLAISRSLVEMHGGVLRADSAGEGRGSTFVLTLPLVDAPQGFAESSLLPAEDGGAARILLVDDNQDAADTAASLLTLSGYQVEVAYDPGGALALLDRFAPQVAVLDIGLPGMSGYELAARLRDHPNGARCHLVALTGYGTVADLAQARSAGFDQHLVKPARPDELLQAVQQGLNAA